MSNKEKLPKLVEVYRRSNPLSRRQLPLVVDENLTLVMDIKSSGIICDNQVLRGRELEEFALKWGVLSPEELKDALQVTKTELMDVLNQNVPCVGCRRSVERLYFQLFSFGHPTLDPIVVKSDGTITIRDDKQTYPILGSIFHDHAVRLSKLIENQPKRNKKSVRCLLHSLDSQRSRPLTPAWRDVWDSMKPECKKDICIIDAVTLHSTLDTYLRKHRFCTECKTKVLKAFALMIEEPDKHVNTKGYVASLYSGITRCPADKHIHLKTQTDYITKLIGRAEPELLGSRRERHAKTLEIAQEEVLACLGVCLYERLSRVAARAREEECTCRMFAAVAVHALSRALRTAVERARGVSQLELLYEEFEREEQAKQIRKEQKKIKRKRKKGKLLSENDKENCSRCDALDDFKDDTEKECSCSASQDDYCSHGEQDMSLNKDHFCEDRGGCQDCGIKINGSLKVDKLRCTNELWIEDCKCEALSKENMNKTPPYKCRSYPGDDRIDKKESSSGSTSDNSTHDCGYSSENNNGCCETGSLISSLSSSTEESELTCSDGCCHHNDNDCLSSYCQLSYGGNGQQLSLQEMLEVHSEDDEECYISPEEVREFKSNSRQVYEKRQELREILQKRFAQFCVNGPLPKYAYN